MPFRTISSQEKCIICTKTISIPCRKPKPNHSVVISQPNSSNNHSVYPSRWKGPFDDETFLSKHRSSIFSSTTFEPIARNIRASMHRRNVFHAPKGALSKPPFVASMNSHRAALFEGALTHASATSSPLPKGGISTTASCGCSSFFSHTSSDHGLDSLKCARSPCTEVSHAIDRDPHCGSAFSVCSGFDWLSVKPAA